MPVEYFQPNTNVNMLDELYKGQTQRLDVQQREFENANAPADRERLIKRQAFADKAMELDSTLKKQKIVVDTLGSIPEGDTNSFERAKQYLGQTLGIDTAQFTVDDLPRLRAQSGQAMEELKLKYQQHRDQMLDKRHELDTQKFEEQQRRNQALEGRQAAIDEQKQKVELKPAEQKMVEKGDLQVESLENLVGKVEEAITRSAKIPHGGLPGSETLPWLLQGLDEDAADVVTFNNLVKEFSLPQLKQLLSGSISDADLKFFMELQATTAKNPKTREANLKRAKDIATRAMEAAKDRVAAIRDKTYFTPGYKPKYRDFKKEKESGGESSFNTSPTDDAPVIRKYNPATRRVE